MVTLKTVKKLNKHSQKPIYKQCIASRNKGAVQQKKTAQKRVK